MKNLLAILEERLSEALRQVSGLPEASALVSPSKNPSFGDYQANGVMAAARQIKTNPRHLAEQVLGILQIEDLCEGPEIAGPGFINLRLKPRLVQERLLGMLADPIRLGIEPTERPQTVVVDYSGPNIAKEMHVGHLRSTILGDWIARVHEFEGHRVVRQNHIGDWGTQFGMLCAYLRTQYPEVLSRPSSAAIADLEVFYQNAKLKSEQDPAFAQLARSEVVQLHRHHPETVRLWQHIVEQSRQHYQPIYRWLNVTLQASDERGESFYAPMLPEVVEELRQKGLAVESEGAICVFPEGFVGKDGAPLPFIIQKSDGAYLYATTDLAALRFRIRELGTEKIVYVTDARQALHFQMLFATARMAGWTDRRVELIHVTFGTMLGPDGRPFKTREGGTVKLKALLEEAVEKARAVVEEKNPSLPEEQKAAIAQEVGIGAVKYADYANNRDTDYVFSFDKMLAMDGNTAPYMQYAYARIRSIERKAAGKEVEIERELEGIERVCLEEPAELDLAKKLLQYEQAIASAAAAFRPNLLTGYLYELSQSFSRFYNVCPVLDAAADVRASRLLLCELTARVILHGMQDLLGIQTPEQM